MPVLQCSRKLEAYATVVNISHYQRLCGWFPEQRKQSRENWLHVGGRDFNNQSTFVNLFNTRIVKKSIIGANSPSHVTQCSFR